MSTKISSKSKGSGGIPTLAELCQERLLRILEKNKFHPRLINDLCKCVPDQRLLEPVLERLLEKKNAITDQALVAFLVPSRTQLLAQGLQTIRNSTLKLIGFNCPNLRVLNLADCDKVSNSVVRGILQGCHSLEHLKLDRCARVTDASFDIHQSPFHTLVGCMSLKSISLQGCPQVTGQVVKTINSICGNLRYLNLSQCRNAQSSYLKEIFLHEKLCALNLSYIEGLDDQLFNFTSNSTIISPYTNSTIISPYTNQLQKIHFGKSQFTDDSLFHMSKHFKELLEVRFQWCSGISDDGVISLVKACTKLRVIDVKSSAITDSSLLAISTYSKDLKVLDVSWCSALTDEGFAAFATDSVSDGGGLREDRDRGDDLDIGDDLELAELDDDFLSLLFDIGSPAESSSSSSSSSLPKKRVGDENNGYRNGFSSSNLQKLIVVWCPLLTDELLLLLQALPALRSVDAMGCAGITAAAVDSFNNAGLGAIINV